MVESALPGPSSVFWWLASEDWLDRWAGLQAEVRVSCELIWAWNSQRAWLLLCGHEEELGETSRGQGGVAYADRHVWRGDRGTCLSLPLCHLMFRVEQGCVYVDIRE